MLRSGRLAGPRSSSAIICPLTLTMPATTARRQCAFIPPVRAVQSSSSGPETSGRQDARQALLECVVQRGFDATAARRTLSRTEAPVGAAATLTASEVAARLQDALVFLLGAGLSIEAAERVWTRCPELAVTSVEDKMRPAAALLAEEPLNLSPEEVGALAGILDVSRNVLCTARQILQLTQRKHVPHWMIAGCNGDACMQPCKLAATATHSCCTQLT